LSSNCVVFGVFGSNNAGTPAAVAPAIAIAQRNRASLTSKTWQHRQAKLRRLSYVTWLQPQTLSRVSIQPFAAFAPESSREYRATFSKETCQVSANVLIQGKESSSPLTALT